MEMKLGDSGMQLQMLLNMVAERDFSLWELQGKWDLANPRDRRHP